MTSNGKYIMMNDIDLTGVEWDAKSFNGEFNGNGYTISNLTDEKGLFSANYGTIKNLNMSCANISGTMCAILVAANGDNGLVDNCSVQGTVNGTIRVGGLIGLCYGVVKNSSSSGTVSGSEHVGGLIGAIENRSGVVVENCISSSNVSATSGNAGGLVAFTRGSMKNCSASGNVEGKYSAGGLAGNITETVTLEYVAASGKVTATDSNAGGLVGQNDGTIRNASASGDVNGVYSIGGLVGVNYSKIENVSATGDVTASGNNSGGLVGSNSGTIKNASASGGVKSTLESGHAQVGGLVGVNTASARIENASATGNVTALANRVGGLVGTNAGIINTSYALGKVESLTGEYSGGFVGMNGGNITDSYSKGDVKGKESVGGFSGTNGGTISNSYTTGNVDYVNSLAGGFTGDTSGNCVVKNCYASGEISRKGIYVGAFWGNERVGMTFENCYSNIEQPEYLMVEQIGVTAMPASWFEDGQNLMFLGDAYDYYYNPPELWGNGEKHPEEVTQFQVGANSGEKNQLDMNLQFRMYNFYGDVTSVESASDTIERVDAFKERLSEHRSMIGAVRNRLDSVLESQSIRLENLNSSHSTLVDTDFAAETAALTRNQILQQATTSLLAQANVTQQLALQLLQ